MMCGLLMCGCEDDVRIFDVRMGGYEMMCGFLMCECEDDVQIFDVRM
jgi:hypothetical protein